MNKSSLPIDPPSPEAIRFFWEHVTRPADYWLFDSCWTWNLAPCDGYGIIQKPHVSRRIKPHRFSFFIHNGYVPTGDGCVLHRCDNRLCVNPAHLFAGTRADNASDRDAKGRNKPAAPGAFVGPRSSLSKLTTEQASEIRRLAKTGMKQRDIASIFGVAQSQIWRIVNNLSYFL